MGDACLALNFSTFCKASNVVMFLKVNGLEGVNASITFLIFRCLLYFIVAISRGSSIPFVEERWVLFSLISSSLLLLVK